MRDSSKQLEVERLNSGIVITDQTFWIGVNDYDTNLFEALWPLPMGVSYNAYMVVDEKITLIDTVKGCYFSVYLDKIKSLLPEGKTVEYLVVNHMEPDHSGAIKALREAFPSMKIIGNGKTAEFLRDYYGLVDDILIVNDGDRVDLGSHQLSFFLVPMVHWPETMVTLDMKNGTLFSSDAFGGFGALNGGIFDDEVDTEYYEDEVLRYFSNIVGRYSPMVQRAISKLKSQEINIIAPSHGPIWRSNPSHIVDLYDMWSKQQTESGAVIVYGSMYGNTQRMMESVARGLVDKGIEKVRIHNVSTSHISFIIRDIWRFKGVVLGSCTYNTELFPPMKQVLSALGNRMIKNRILGIFGSYTWSGGALKELQEFADSCSWNRVEPVIEAKASPSESDLKECRELGRNMAEKLTE